MTSDIPDSAACVEAALTGFVKVAEIMIRAGVVPPYPHDMGVRYQLEPPGEEDWKLPIGVQRDGWGDCEDLAIHVVAGLHVTGEDPDAFVQVVQIAPGKLHAVVRRGDGSIEDPSLDLHPQLKAQRDAAANQF